MYCRIGDDSEIWLDFLNGSARILELERHWSRQQAQRLLMKLAQAAAEGAGRSGCCKGTHVVIVILLPFSGHSGGQRSRVAAQG